MKFTCLNGTAFCAGALFTAVCGRPGALVSPPLRAHYFACASTSASVTSYALPSQARALAHTPSTPASKHEGSTRAARDAGGAPVQQRLPDDGRDGGVVPRGVGVHNLVQQRALPAALGARHARPAADLARVVRGAAAEVEAAVPAWLRAASAHASNTPLFLHTRNTDHWNQPRGSCALIHPCCSQNTWSCPALTPNLFVGTLYLRLL